ncbi:hypothetical protein M9H77_02148 [Catharanthus roseus]|uniref:Uncharacterized protein n=1 Tax=Catharanthus roseus TaxID=4058 RepID=A0ACC0C811_CATRO|nr:hypothetical protein M9H77_02148 [Catharanthus roseus]
MVDYSCGGTFLHKTADEAWDLFENLSDNSQQHATPSRIGTSRQIGNRVGIYEVSQNVDLSLKVDALSKKFDQLLALNTLPTNSPNVQGVCAICSSPSHEQVNSAQRFQKQNDPYSNTYNSGLISPGGNKEGKVNWASNNINKTNNLGKNQKNMILLKE